MRLLYFSNSGEDYLSDSLLHGLRSLLGNAVVDYPKCEILYKGCLDLSRQRVRGNAFTLYGLLDDIEIDRSHIVERTRANDFDLIVFSNIWQQFGWYTQLRPWLDPSRTVILDGADTPRVYPYAGHWYRRPYFWFLPQTDGSLYFKREWTSQTQFGWWTELVPKRLRGLLPSSTKLRRIAFSIPEEKILLRPPTKLKDFPLHIVDAELAQVLSSGRTSYAFSKEREYYADLQAARFGITTMRAGWDCLRHYEIAANGAVPCFRDLKQKPSSCAPHGLDEENCIAYSDAADLLEQVRALSSARYSSLQANALRWARANSTTARAREFLAAVAVPSPHQASALERSSEDTVYDPHASNGAP